MQTPEPAKLSHIDELKRTLTKAMVDGEAARTLVLSLRQDIGIQDQKLVGLTDQAASARRQMGLAGSPVEIAEAKSAYKEIQENYPVQEARQEQLEIKLIEAEKASDLANRQMSHWSSELAVAIARKVEAEGLKYAQLLGPLMIKRLGLAKFASSAATLANGGNGCSDPLGATVRGEMSPWHHAIEAALHPPTASTPAICNGDLLAWV